MAPQVTDERVLTPSAVPILDPPGEKQIIKSPHSPAEIEQAGELLLGARDTVRDCQKDLDLLNLVLEKIHNQMRGLTPEFRRTVLTAALEKAKRELRPIAAFAALEADVRTAVDGLDLKTRAIIGMLAQMVGTDGGADFGDAIRDELENDAEAIDEARVQAGDDPVMRALYKGYRLARLINGEDDDISTEELFAEVLEHDGGSTPSEGDEVDGPEAGIAETEAIVNDVIAECEDRASRHLSLERTTDLKGVVAWLLSRTFDSKLAALALSELVVDDIQTNIQRNGFYDGLIGHDLERTWETDVAKALEGDEATSGISAESRLVANFLKGLRANA